MRWPWIDRTTHEEAIAAFTDVMNQAGKRYDDLLEKYHSLRKEGYAPVKPAKVIPQKDPEARVLKDHEQEFLERAADALVTQHGYDRSTALKEARRLRAEIDDMHPSTQ